MVAELTGQALGSQDADYCAAPKMWRGGRQSVANDRLCPSGYSLCPKPMCMALPGRIDQCSLVWVAKSLLANLFPVGMRDPQSAYVRTAFGPKGTFLVTLHIPPSTPFRPR